MEDNETDLACLKYLDKQTFAREKGLYQILLLDGHESYVSAAFDNYYKSHNIIILCLLPHLSHLIQLLDVDYFSVLKQEYSRQIEDFMKVHINHITKVKFFIAFRTVYLKSIIVQNTKSWILHCMFNSSLS